MTLRTILMTALAAIALGAAGAVAGRAAGTEDARPVPVVAVSEVEREPAGDAAVVPSEVEIPAELPRD